MKRAWRNSLVAAADRAENRERVAWFRDDLMAAKGQSPLKVVARRYGVSPHSLQRLWYPRSVDA